jgi:hypothetical protein
VIPEPPNDAGTLDTALSLAAAGFYILPGFADTKRPAVGNGWQHKSSRDPAQIAAWFAGTDHVVLVHCGRSGLVVFDVDEFDQVPDVMAEHLSTAPFQATRPDEQPGRGHYLFAQPAGRSIGNSTGSLANGWGEVRGLNGLILVAPAGTRRWVRTGEIPVLPEELAEALNDASPASDAASDAAVKAFITEHTDRNRPGVLAGHVCALKKKFAAGESRHMSLVSVLTGAMKEARIGLYTAQEAIDTLRDMFLAEVAKQPASAKQGEPRKGKVAESEFAGILGWAVGQALAADPDDIRTRVNEKMPATNLDAPKNDSANFTDDTAAAGDMGSTTGSTDSWAPVDLGPYLRGEIVPPQPTIGIVRSDGLRLIYPGREHAILGETECGKTWLALGCVAAELNQGNHVVYVHYEESDATSTVERLQLLGVDESLILQLLHFLTPTEPATPEQIARLVGLRPSLVVHDGVNEAMALHNDEIYAVAGGSAFRRRLVVPFLAVGAATVACDHLPLGSDRSRRDAFGTVHKGNTLNGARLLLENKEPFGRDMRGRSNVFVTKDRPGQLRSRGKPADIPGKTFMGTLIVDDATAGPDFIVKLLAPKLDDDTTTRDTSAELAAAVHKVILAQPDHAVSSLRHLYAQMRKAGVKFRESTARDAVDDLVAAGVLEEIRGKNRATGYRAVLSAAGEGGDE